MQHLVAYARNERNADYADAEAEKESDALAAALRARDLLLPVMDTLRAAADEAEEIVPREEWPFPTYGDLLFGVSK